MKKILLFSFIALVLLSCLAIPKTVQGQFTCSLNGHYCSCTNGYYFDVTTPYHNPNDLLAPSPYVYLDFNSTPSYSGGKINNLGGTPAVQGGCSNVAFENLFEYNSCFTGNHIDFYISAQRSGDQKIHDSLLCSMSGSVPGSGFSAGNCTAPTDLCNGNATVYINYSLTLPWVDKNLGTYYGTTTTPPISGTWPIRTVAITGAANCNPVPTVKCTPKTSTISKGTKQTFTATATGGTGFPSYLWSSPTDCDSSQALSTCSKTYTSTGTFTGTVTVTASGQQSAPDSCTVTVQNSAVTASCSASPSSVGLNQTVVWTAIPSGGSGTGYTYIWSGTDELSKPIPAIGNPVSVTYANPGPKTGSVIVTDSDGNSSASIPCTTTVSVSAPGECGPDASPPDAGTDYQCGLPARHFTSGMCTHTYPGDVVAVDIPATCGWHGSWQCFDSNGQNPVTCHVFRDTACGTADYGTGKHSFTYSDLCNQTNFPPSPYTLCQDLGVASAVTPSIGPTMGGTATWTCGVSDPDISPNLLNIVSCQAQSTCPDSGLRVWNGTKAVNIAGVLDGSCPSTSPSLKIKENTGIYDILLANPGNPYDSGVRIQTSPGTTKAMEQCP